MCSLTQVRTVLTGKNAILAALELAALLYQKIWALQLSCSRAQRQRWFVLHWSAVTFAVVMGSSLVLVL